MQDEVFHPVLVPFEQIIDECEVRRQRRSGPGGQHRNKVATAIFLKHLPTGVEAQASERRSQAENQRVAVKRLRVNMALEMRSERLGEASPTELWRSRCRDGKISVNPDHVDFAPLLAEALDVIMRHRYDVHGAAQQLECTYSQLLKFLRLEDRAVQLVDRERQERGQPKLPGS